MAMNECYFCSTQIKATVNNCPQCGQPQMMQGKYRLVRLLGQGGFGIVYEALDTRLNRRYAVKLITTSSAAHQKQVEAEANILAQHARHLAFMPEVYDTWSEGSRTVLVMEYIEGPTLGELLASQGAWPADEVEAFLRTMLGHLAQLHGAGIIHRDLKPENIKRTPQGRYVLLDFGIAKQSGGTLTGAKALSLYYSPPEQARGQSTDARSDIYSLAATAYHLLTGSPPSPSEYRASMGIPLIPPGEKVPDVPETLELALIAMLEISPDDRPADATAALGLLDTPAAHLRVASAVGAAAQLGAQSRQPALAKATIVLPQGQAPDAPNPPRTRGRRRFGAGWLLSTVGILLAVSLAAFGINGMLEDDDPPSGGGQIPGDTRPTPTSEPMLADATAAPPAVGALPPLPQDGAGGEPFRGTDAPPAAIKLVSSMPAGGAAQDTLDGYHMRLAETPELCGGIQIQFDALDSSSSADPWGQAAANAQHAAANRDTLVFLTTDNALALRQSIPVLNQAGISVISTEATDPALTKPAWADQAANEPDYFYPNGQRNFARVMPTDELQGIVGARWVRDLGLETVLVIDDNQPMPILIAKAFEAEASSIGLKLAGHLSIDGSAPLADDQLNQIADIDPDLIFFSSANVQAAGTLLYHLRNGPLAEEEIMFMATNRLHGHGLLEAAGPSAEGALIIDPALPPAELGDLGQKWAETYRSQFGRDPSYHAAYAYEAMSLAISALESSCDNLSAEHVRAQLFANRRYPSILGAGEIDTNGDTLLATLAGFEVEKGEFVFERQLK